MGSEVATREGRRSVVLPVVVLVAVMWVAEALDWLLPVDADSWGIRSRTLGGLVGIPLSPFLHNGFGHLLANTIPLLVLGIIVSWRAASRFWSVVVTIVLVGGSVVWLFGSSGTVTIGASGLVFGLLTYLITAGALTRHWLDVLVAVGVLLMYGGLLLGAVPFMVPAGVSWLGHLGGALGGVVAAFFYSRKEVPS